MEEILHIVWNDYNKTGIPIIDEQHRGIVSAINSLHYFIRRGQEREIINPTMITLSQYINIHFTTEEALMTEARYPELENHILLHEALKKNTDRIFHDDHIINNPDTVLKFFKEWWLGHINKEDKRYAPFLIKNNE